MTHHGLLLVLILLVFSVAFVALARLCRLPALLGYIVTGAILGPHALGLVAYTPSIETLAEFGVVFMMFSIGLEFNFSQLLAMRQTIFGLGGAQVLTTIVLVALAALFFAAPLSEGLILGCAFAMSSTAVVARVLTEKLELQARYGRVAIGILLFQDLAVVPILIMIPALASTEPLAYNLGMAFLKIIVALLLILFLGRRILRPWFYWVAHFKSGELFVLNVLLVALGLAYLTASVGLSMALGAFLAGMLIAETPYRYQVEADISPFREVLLGLFFVTMGMQFNLALSPERLGVLALIMVLLMPVKGALIAFLTRFFGESLENSIRVGLTLAQGGEFGLVILNLAAKEGLLGQGTLELAFTAILFGLALTPFVIHADSKILRLFSRSKTIMPSLEHEAMDEHVIVCGFGRTAQNLCRFLESENIPFVAIDLDPVRVQEAHLAGERIIYGNAARPEVLAAAGLAKAKALIITVADHDVSLKILHLARLERLDIPILVRTADESMRHRMEEAGATEVVADVMESALVLAWHTLLLLGTPIAKAVRLVRLARDDRYRMLRGFYRGAEDFEMASEQNLPRFHSVRLEKNAFAIEKNLQNLNLEQYGVEVRGIVRKNGARLEPKADLRLQAEDTVVLCGAAEAVLLAEKKLLSGEE